MRKSFARVRRMEAHRIVHTKRSERIAILDEGVTRMGSRAQNSRKGCHDQQQDQQNQEQSQQNQQQSQQNQQNQQQSQQNRQDRK